MILPAKVCEDGKWLRRKIHQIINTSGSDKNWPESRVHPRGRYSPWHPVHWASQLSGSQRWLQGQRAELPFQVLLQPTCLYLKLLDSLIRIRMFKIGLIRNRNQTYSSWFLFSTVCTVHTLLKEFMCFPFSFMVIGQKIFREFHWNYIPIWLDPGTQLWTRQFFYIQEFGFSCFFTKGVGSVWAKKNQIRGSIPQTKGDLWKSLKLSKIFIQYF